MNLKNIVTAALMITLFTQCSEEEIIEPVRTLEATTISATSERTSTVASLSISGLFTEFSAEADCKRCDFTVDEKTTTIDGEALGIKPGNTICLKRDGAYQPLDFVNMFGTAEQPIIIVYSDN